MAEPTKPPAKPTRRNASGNGKRATPPEAAAAIEQDAAGSEDAPKAAGQPAPVKPDSPTSPDTAPSADGPDSTSPESEGSIIMDINFFDLAKREDTARTRIVAEWQILQKRQDRNRTANSTEGALGAEDQKEYDRLTALKQIAEGKGGARPQFLDPLFASARALFAQNEFGLTPIAVHYDYVTPHPKAILKVTGLTNEAEAFREVTRVALTLGLLQMWDTPLPQLAANSDKNAVPDEKHRNYRSFGEGLVRAMARASANMPLAIRILQTLVEAVKVEGSGRDPGVSTLEFAKTFDKLIESEVAADDPSIKLLVENTFERVKRIGDDSPMHEFVLKLPDLEAATDIEVIPEHCRLMGSFIFASAFEELKAFQVVDKLIELSQRGDIPLMRGKAGTQLYNYWRDAPNRMSEIERQNFYAMTLGLPTGQPGVAINADFQDLWLRFVSSVSTLVRESRVENLLRSNIPLAVNQQQVKKAARDLAHNMSSRGYGMTFYAAADLNKQINEIIELLSDKDLQRVFGANSAYDVIEQVSHTELGGARNSSKYRMLATSGAIITNWIAEHAERLRDPTAQMINLNEVAYPPARGSGESAVSHPTDYDLVNACEMWLADSAMGDDRVAMLSEPRESPQHASRPIQIPSIARDLLEGTGLGLGMEFVAPQAARANGRAHGAYGAY
jgi:hypothetical protein